MVNETLIAQSQNSKLFRRWTSPFLHSKATNPLKPKRVNSQEKIYTPKFRLLFLLTHEINPFAGRCWKHVRTAQEFTMKWPTGPGWRGSSTSAEVGNLRIPKESLPSLYIRNAKLPIHCYTELLIHCYVAIEVYSTLPTSDWRRLLVVARFYTGVTHGGGGAKLSVSFSRPGELPSTSLHWPSRRPLIHTLHAKGSY